MDQTEETFVCLSCQKEKPKKKEETQQTFYDWRNQPYEMVACRDCIDEEIRARNAFYYF